MKHKFVVTFAGVPGSSKSIVANHLSFNFGLPIVNKDQLRHEVKENLMLSNINNPKALSRFEELSKTVHNQVFSTGISIILDRSVDRKWGILKQDLIKYGYEWFLISFDYSSEFMSKLYIATNRQWAVAQLDAYDKQHQDFLKNYSRDVNLHLEDADFTNRVKICVNAVDRWIKAG
ncbi:hypothetical protein KBB76_02900 [Candidatus Saccharibacteria bacterium]|jgi:predicted kinase|nr:hypothetical protein [Candidatus Saccharibacteria bacterium]HPW47844.1 hypothetical protein [Candidatus Saccharibacteria bacterium]